MDSLIVLLKGGSSVRLFSDNDYVEQYPDGTRFHYFEFNGFIVMCINENEVVEVKQIKC